MHRYSSGPTLPVEVYKHIVKYLAEDARSLRNISLVCRCLRTIAQSILFSSVVFTGEEKADKLLSTLQSKHSQILSYIHTLTLISRAPSEWLSAIDRPESRLFKLIVKQARDLRAVQIGPFYLQQYATEDEKDLVVSPLDGDETEFELSNLSESVATLIAEVFPRLETIVLEDVWFVPVEDVQQWRRVKTLQVPSKALIVRAAPDSSRSRRMLENQGYTLPAPTTLTVYGDTSLYEEPHKWHGYSISFGNIKDLRMEITGDGEYHLFNMIMQARRHSLESLRFFICREPWDQVLDLSGLSSLKSLYLVIYDLANPVRVLSQIFNWLNVSDLECLEELCLYIHVDKEQRGDWLLQIVEGQERKQYKMFWRIISKKLGGIFAAKITHVSLKLPPSGDLSRDKILEYIHEVMPSTTHQSFHLKDTEAGSQAIFQPMFTRADAQALSAIKRKIAAECRKSLRRDSEPSC